ncbi:uncharacterized protein N7483_009366 [Penicillium malachiteum]|uniref:uncharacterized protein n=1 Tax=Penicillium malachiteum TaxID=1324776 RepID=UPI002548B983|nr:uncharacterized protein N7483_009366 [Penicillium malachiteum]KAJ5721432.1 hypothetical protein N7483_009366 [Penicillium malachiteum]
MERVIELYQPAVNSTWKEEFPSFEDLLQQVGASDIPLHFIATIEVLYHAAAIISCRSASPDGVSPTSESKLRQSFSASRVTSIVGEEIHNELRLFPIVPYAVALSLRVSYQTLQQSKAQIFQARARKQLVLNCQILKELGKVFYSASLMADLGEYLIDRRDGQTAAGGDGMPERNDGPNLLTRMNIDNSLPGNSAMQSNQQAETEPFQTPYQPFETGFFDSMSTLGIFDNFDLDSGIFGSMNQGSA